MMSHSAKKQLFGHHRSPSMEEFKEVTQRDAEIRMAHELDKLRRTAQLGSDVQAKSLDMQFDGFKKLFAQYLTVSADTSIQWNKIEKLPGDAIIPYEQLKTPSKQEINQMLKKLAVVKLNGGLGTSMGCKGPKSVIPIRNDLTFLDLTVQQIEHLNKTYDADVPLILMNSFNTDEDTAKIIRKYAGFKVRILTFNQSKYPRFEKETLLPLAQDINSENHDAWYPPGHGDFYQSFSNSGLLADMIAEGRSICFVSNIDNTGAVVDVNILNAMGESGDEFIMEVTEKTMADVKGGTLVQYENKLRLLELAQVPKPFVEEFKSVRKFNVFNTNSIWVDLNAVQRVMEEGTLEMEIIVNPKTTDDGVQVIQLETAVGAAMKCFEKAKGIKVPRSRFLPVKKTDDLLLIKSNLYTLQNGVLKMSPERQFGTTPLVKCGAKNFSKVKEFMMRFPTIPDVLELNHLTVSGDVNFGRNVILKGTVIVIANHGDRIDIPDGAVLENKIVSGNLRIINH